MSQAIYIKPLHRRTRWTARKEELRDAISNIVSLSAHPRVLINTVSSRLREHLTLMKNGFSGASIRTRVSVIALAVMVVIAGRFILMGIGTQTVDHIIAESLKRQARIEELLTRGKDRDALALIDSSLVYLENAPQRLSPAQASALETVRGGLLKSASRITKMIIISDPTPVVSMEKSFRAQRKFDLKGLALSQGKLYTVNAAEKEIYEMDGRERRIVVLDDVPADAGKPVSIVTAPPGKVYVLTESPAGILELDAATRSFSFAPVVYPHPQTIASAWAMYHDRLYLLDARSRAIYRYEKTENGGYNLWSPWTADNAIDLSQATAINVDGAIYVAFNDQRVIRLVQGKETPFPLEKIRPPFEQISAIATREESPLLYLLDVPQRRVVVTSKEDGALIAQYMSPQFTDLRGVFPDEAARRIYILSGDTIYSVGPGDKSLTNQAQ